MNWPGERCYPLEQMQEHRRCRNGVPQLPALSPRLQMLSPHFQFFFTWEHVFFVFFTCDEENWGLLWLSLACIGNNWNMFEFDVKSLAIDIM